MVKTAAYLRTRAFRVTEESRWRGDDGATATEYGLLVAFVAFLIIFGVSVFGTALSTWFEASATAVGGWNATNP